MRRFLFSLVLSTLLLAENGWGATYYVNKTGGSDANNGLSTGSAWKTIAKVNASSYAAGDSILFKRGETWREQLTPNRSGTPINIMTFGAYGSGSNPIINGSDIVSTWSDNTNNLWTATLTTQPRQVFFNGTRGTLAANVGNVNNTNKWYWSGNVLYIYSTSDPDTAYTSPGIEASQRENCVNILNKSYINVNSFDCQKSNLDGFYALANGTNQIAGITWDNNTATYSFWNGFYLENGVNATSDDILITRSNGSYNGRTGFLAVNLTTGNNRVTVDNCSFYYNGQLDDTYGVGVYSNQGAKSTKVTVKHCNVYNQNKISIEGTGIQFDDDTDDNIAEYNYVHDNGGGGIHSGNRGDNNTVRYNLVINNSGWGIAGTGSTSGTNIYNNGIYRRSGGSGYFGIYLFGSGKYNVKNNILMGGYDYGINNVNSETTTTCTNNVIYNYVIGATYNITCTSSIISDPRMTDPANGVFTLQASSPAINAGTSVGLTRDFSGNLVPFGSAPDIGAYEYTSLKMPAPPSSIIISP